MVLINQLLTNQFHLIDLFCFSELPKDDLFAMSNTLNVTNCTSNNCTSNMHADDRCTLDAVGISLILGYTLLLLTGTFGNALVIMVFKKSLRHGKILDLLIFFLAICDLASSCISPLLFTYWILTCNYTWNFGWLGCKIIPTLSRVLNDISIGVLLIMAIDRCRAIATPMKSRYSRAFVVKLLIATVLLSFLCQTYYMIALDLVDGKCQAPDNEDPNFYLPLIILVSSRTFAFLFIFWISTFAVQVALRRTKSVELLARDKTRRLSQKSKVMKMLVVMATTFTVTVIPRDIFHLAYQISYLRPPIIEYT